MSKNFGPVFYLQITMKIRKDQSAVVVARADSSTCNSKKSIFTIDLHFKQISPSEFGSKFVIIQGMKMITPFTLGNLERG